MLSIAIVGNCTSLGGCRTREKKEKSLAAPEASLGAGTLGPAVGLQGGKLGAPASSCPRCLQAQVAAFFSTTALFEQISSSTITVTAPQPSWSR